jgi:3-oxoacyl-[acyl-carrier-protein] synthase I
MTFDNPGRRVVVTGMGIVSCLGNDLATVHDNLRHLRSGIVHMPEQEALGFRSHVAGKPQPVSQASLDRIPRKPQRTMSDGALWNTVAALNALEMAGLYDSSPLEGDGFAKVIKTDRTGALMATGTGSSKEIYEAAAAMHDPERKSPGRAPFAVSRTMASTNSANIQWIGLRGPSYTISSACASSAIAIGEAAKAILNGECDVMLAGGGDNLDLEQTWLFDGMQALSSKRNGDPERASRAFDADRDGFVIAGGGGCLVLEDHDHAKARGATILAHVAGYGNTTDGSLSASDPTVHGPLAAMRKALAGIGLDDLDYINVHGTSTKVGDLNEMRAIEELYAEIEDTFDLPNISSTKSLTGHPLGTAGVHEAIYSILMLQGGFFVGSANLDELDPEIAKLRVSGAILKETANLMGNPLYALSNSFGFGGTNASLLFKAA